MANLYTTTAWTILESRGSSMTWLAKQTGFNVSYLFHVRSGRRPITDEFARRVSLALGLPVGAVFFVSVGANAVAETANADSERAAD